MNKEKILKIIEDFLNENKIEEIDTHGFWCKDKNNKDYIASCTCCSDKDKIVIISNFILELVDSTKKPLDEVVGDILMYTIIAKNMKEMGK